jgi:hypothetical protein
MKMVIRLYRNEQMKNGVGYPETNRTGSKIKYLKSGLNADTKTNPISFFNYCKDYITNNFLNKLKPSLKNTTNFTGNSPSSPQTTEHHDIATSFTACGTSQTKTESEINWNLTTKNYIDFLLFHQANKQLCDIIKNKADESCSLSEHSKELYDEITYDCLSKNKGNQPYRADRETIVAINDILENNKLASSEEAEALAKARAKLIINLHFVDIIKKINNSTKSEGKKLRESLAEGVGFTVLGLREKESVFFPI